MYGLLVPEHILGWQTVPAEGTAPRLHRIEARWELHRIMHFPELISALWRSPEIPWAEAWSPGSTGHACSLAVLCPSMCPSRAAPSTRQAVCRSFPSNHLAGKTRKTGEPGLCWRTLGKPKAQLGGKQPWSGGLSPFTA